MTHDEHMAAGEAALAHAEALVDSPEAAAQIQVLVLIATAHFAAAAALR